MPSPPRISSAPPLPSKMSFPPLPVNKLTPLLPFNLFAESLPVAFIFPKPVRVKFSTLLSRVNVAEECTASVPESEPSVMESLVSSTI